MSNDEQKKDKKEKKHAGGRPSKYKPEYAAQAYKLALLGAIDTQIAHFFEVAESTVSLWKVNFPEFSEALKNGKIVADTEVADSLRQRALGYSHPEVHITNYQGEITVTPIVKHYPPDTTACIFWLKNRQPKQWRDQQDLRVTEVPPEPTTVEEVKERIAALEAAGDGLATDA